MFTEEFSKISVKGKMFDKEQEITFFRNNERINMIYGKNGSGKSTIASFFKKDSGEFEKLQYMSMDSNILIKDENVYVFDEEFIEKNIKFKDDGGLESIIILGNDIEIDNEIENITKEIDNYDELIKQSSEIVGKLDNESNEESYKNIKSKILEKLRGDNCWAGRNKKINRLQRNASVTEEVFENLTKIKLEKIDLDNNIDEYKKLFETYEKSINFSEKIYNELNLIELNNNYDDIKNLICIQIDKPILSDRELKILNLIENGYQAFYERSKKDFSDVEINECPYCLQSISEYKKQEVVKIIENVLNKEVEIYSEKLSGIKIEKINLELNIYMNVDERLCSELLALCSEYNRNLDLLNDMLILKKSNIYMKNEVIDYSFEENLKNINQKIIYLKNSTKKYNEDRDSVEVNKKRLIYLNDIIAVGEINSEYKNYVKTKNMYNDEKEKITKFRTEKSKKDIERNQLRSKKSNSEIALAKINKALAYIFFNKERLKIEFYQNKYYIKVNGKSVKVNKLSVGEKNIIGLAYFMNKILELKNEIDNYNFPIILILDDPISSFDFENKIGIYTYIREIFSNILRNNAKSKIILLSHSLEAIYNFEKIFSDIKDEIGKVNCVYSVNEIINKNVVQFESQRRNEYSKMIQLIFSFIENPDIEDQTPIIGNIMRKLLEAYSTFNYKKSINGICNNDKILSKLNDENKVKYYKNLMYRLILHGESHFEEKAKSLPDTDFYECISKEEKIITAKSILLLLYLLDEEHIKSHIGDNQDINKIKSWDEEIFKI